MRYIIIMSICTMFFQTPCSAAEKKTTSSVFEPAKSKKTKFQLDIETIKSLISNRQFGLAETKLKSLNPSSANQKAVIAFQQARIEGKLGNYKYAKQLNASPLKNRTTRNAAFYNQICFSCLAQNKSECGQSLVDFADLIRSFSSKEVSLFLELVFKDPDLKFARDDRMLRENLGQVVYQLMERKFKLSMEDLPRYEDSTFDDELSGDSCEEKDGLVVCSCG